MVATVAGIHLGLDTHANRPAANTVPDGSQYSCSTHGLIYKSNFAGNSWATWATLGGTGLSDPMTTRGDLIIRNSSNTTARLGRGSAGQVLTSDGTDIAWATPSGGGGTFPLGLAAPDKIPASPGTHDEEWEGTADTLPTNWAWVSAAPTFNLNSAYPSWFVIERADTTERKLRRSSFTMAATSGLWIKMGNGTKNGSSSQFEFIIYDSASSNGYGFGIHNGNVAVARDSNAGTLANRGTWTLDDGHASAYYFGVMRVSDTWQTWFSMDGLHWTEIQAADTRAFTVDRLELRWSTDSSIKARGTVDWIRYRTDNLFPKP